MRGSNKVIIRIMPYPPSFKRTAARIIDPAMGASTWALGSHKWTPYRGIFTRKAIRQPVHHSLSAVVVILKVGVYWRVIRERVPAVFWRRSRATKRGREPASV